MIGAIADDFTGATDIAVAFRRAGLKVAVYFNVPPTAPTPGLDVAIVALKTRTVEPEAAVRLSLQALAWLQAHGADRFFYKYCSTFDSRPSGNIGPVVDALAHATGAQRVVFVPASPEHLRTQYMGHLFVDQLLLSDSHMRHHPLTPMTDSFVPALLRAQTRTGVGLVDRRDVRAGASQLTERLVEEAGEGRPYVVVDAMTEADLATIGEAVRDDVLVTGAAGLAGGLGLAQARALARHVGTAAVEEEAPSHRAAALAGSCSARTLEQISYMQRHQPAYLLDAVAVPDAAALATAALDWFDEQEPSSAPLLYSSLPPEQLRRAQEELGTARAADILETATGEIARGLVERGVDRLVIAGGETSGAVVTALEVDGGVVGEEEAPGVPWISTGGERPLHLLLKSGNFGDPELLVRATSKGIA